ncbi:MAG: PorT family protein [Bdellovibrionaceae bacterium]|nr:PorT family protein [Pseudobdellovibrionaceae bacterium]
MKNLILKTLTVIAIFGTGFVAPTWAGVFKERDAGSLIFSGFGVINRGVEDNGSGSEDDQYHFGVGALVEANINGVLGIETGAIFIKRQYDYEAAGFRLVQEVNRLHIPILARVWLGDYFSVGAGPFASIKVGNVKDSLEFGSTPIGSVETKADDSVEFGYDIAATFNFAVSDKTGIFIEARYSSPFDKAKNTDYETLTGLAGVKVDL